MATEEKATLNQAVFERIDVDCDEDGDDGRTAVVGELTVTPVVAATLGLVEGTKQALNERTLGTFAYRGF